MFTAPAELARSALEAAPDAMVIIDETGVIRFANRQVSALFGYTHEQIVGQWVELLLPERFRVRHRAHREQYASGPCMRPMGASLQLLGRRRDGSEFPVEISLSPIEGQGRPLVAAAIRDVSDRKRIESELIAARGEAEKAREAADYANRAKSRFLATASHDLRQPLQTLALLNGTLRRTVTDAQAAEALSQQEQSITAMSRLLNALLDISKLESGAVKPEPADFAVATVFEELRREFAGIAAGKGLRLEVEPSSVCVHSDRSLLEQVLRNLVSNAIKYTRRGRVALRCLLTADSLVSIQVLDTGIGIAADQLGSICDEFYQVEVAASSSRDGYGLGLSIVKRITELLDLRLEVRSELGRGSSFTVLLPPAQAPLAAARVGSHGERARSACADRRGIPHVLLVEDDSAVREATRMLLAIEGYRVTAVASLGEAAEAARSGVDLLVTDYHLGHGQTGVQVIAEVRQAAGAGLGAVLITGDTSMAIRELPRDPHLRIASKPVNAEELLTLLRELTAYEGPADRLSRNGDGCGYSVWPARASGD
ncbi:MAG TPA: PAS domain S-box protein [Steroidobacteraceae bacterium]|nr:PAS domain S-box protein [Steroidobacteraceae bacterium]